MCLNQVFRTRKIPQHLVSLWIGMGIRDLEKGNCTICKRDERNGYCSGYVPVTLHAYSVVEVAEVDEIGEEDVREKELAYA